MEKAPSGVGMSFLVIDTEGKDSLKEIAIIDSKGRVVYHGFNQAEHPRHPECRPLSEIIAATQNIMADYRLVFHYAEHDLGVLSQAFQLTGRKLAKELYPALGSYSRHRGDVKLTPNRGGREVPDKLRDLRELTGKLRFPKTALVGLVKIC